MWHIFAQQRLTPRKGAFLHTHTFISYTILSRVSCWHFYFFGIFFSFTFWMRVIFPRVFISSQKRHIFISNRSFSFLFFILVLVPFHWIHIFPFLQKVDKRGTGKLLCTLQLLLPLKKVGGSNTQKNYYVGFFLEKKN